MNPETSVISRRRAVAVLAGGASAFLAACSDNTRAARATSAAGTTNTSATTSPGPGSSGATDCPPVVPEETAGPYPGDGSNGPDALSDPAVVRRDITTSFGQYTGTAAGVPTTIELTLLDSATCAPKKGAAVYLWHADQDGHYSMYTAPEANYLRGVGEADADGVVAFDSIWPGCYDGRWPHVHFEVYPSVADALAAQNRITTSQIALPEAECQKAYAATGYETSVTNLTHASLATDMVFRDGWDQELGSAAGTNDAGWTVALTISV
jgi:protocatechuate 3,4-dioxygenase beta subunit